jgi:hypothetical protein
MSPCIKVEKIFGHVLLFFHVAYYFIIAISFSFHLPTFHAGIETRTKNHIRLIPQQVKKISQPM